MKMGQIGQLQTEKSIEAAMREIREWLLRIGVNAMGINMNWDARINVAVLRFRFKEQDYEFRSTKQTNCRLNMWGIARVMEYKVRSHLMGIEDFAKSMKAYVALEDKSGISSINQQPPEQNIRHYVTLGISQLSSNEEIKARYKELVKSFHPDLAGSELAKKEFEKRLSEINEAYTEIKKERSIN